MIKRIVCLFVAVMLISSTLVLEVSATRIKDIAKVEGVRTNQLIGYGLVVGLNGTGDSDKTEFTLQSVVNMMRNFGITVTADQMKLKNIAAVMVTTNLPAFTRPGDNIDITVSSIGDAKSLQGGTLLQTPLKAANGQIYAVGQGPLSIGGYSAGGRGNSQQKNFPTVGLIPNGAIVEREVATKYTSSNGQLNLILNSPDFTTANRIVDAIGTRFGYIAQAKDAGSVNINIPSGYEGDVVGFIAAFEELYIEPDNIAKIVVNERTGTIVMGSNVTIDQVAVSHGSLTVKIESTTDVTQPPPFSNGSTVVTQDKTLTVDEQQGEIVLLPAAASVGDVVTALNAVGATPRDIIAILQAMKSAGAIRAELQLI